MNQLVFIENQKVVTDSLVVAEMFGKEHKNVLRDINTQIEYAGDEFSQLNFEPSNYEVRGKQYPKYNLTEEAFTLVVFSYNTKEAVQTKIKFIQEFKRMREYIENQQQKKFTAREQLLLIMQANEETAQRVDAIEEKVNVLHDTMRMDSKQEKEMNYYGKAKAIEALGGKESNAYKQIGKQTFKALWKDMHNHFDVSTYKDIPKSRFDEAMRFISMWQPSTSLRMDIENCNRQIQLQLVK